MVFRPAPPRRQRHGALVIARIHAFVGTLFMARQKLRAPRHRGSSYRFVNLNSSLTMLASTLPRKARRGAQERRQTQGR
jgi:hypothetical protein